MSADSPVIPELLVALQGAKDATQAKGKADELSLAIKRSDIEALSTHSVLDTVSAWSLSKVEQERANAAITFGRLIVNLGAGTEAVFLPYLESLFNLLNEKTAAIRTSAQSALNTFVKICPPEATRLVFVVLRDCLKSLGGWRSQIGVLKALEAMVKEGATENVAAELGATIPLVEKAMHDTKAEVRFPPFFHEILFCRSPSMLTFPPSLLLGRYRCQEDGPRPHWHALQPRPQEAP
jgi:elongation factor 3